MTMTAKRLAELDAAIARFPVSLPWYSCATSRNGVTGIHGEPHGEPPHQGVAYLADVFGDAAPVVEAMNSLPDLRAHIDALAATIVRLQEAHETVCEIWGNQERGDLYLDWEDAADDMHNTSVAALTGAA